MAKTRSLKYCRRCGKTTSHTGEDRGLGDWDATCSKCGAYSKHEFGWGYTINEDRPVVAHAKRGFL